MTYTAPSAVEFRTEKGSASEKITAELALIDASLDALGSGTGELADGKIWIGGATGVCAAQTMSGDATLARTGAITIGSNKITSAKTSPQFLKCSVTALTAGNQNAFALAWQNPESYKIIVWRVVIDVTTAGGTALAVIDAGSGATATTASDNLLDGIDITSTGIFDNITNKGTNGKSIQKLDENGGTTDYITAQILTANAASLAGYAYIYYTAVPAA